MRSDLAPPVLPPSADAAPAAGESEATLAMPLASKQEIPKNADAEAGAQQNNAK